MTNPNQGRKLQDLGKVIRPDQRGRSPDTAENLQPLPYRNRNKNRMITSLSWEETVIIKIFQANLLNEE
jgi:hypothetical protein